jgi:hypothetical protein
MVLLVAYYYGMLRACVGAAALLVHLAYLISSEDTNACEHQPTISMILLILSWSMHAVHVVCRLLRPGYVYDHHAMQCLLLTKKRTHPSCPAGPSVTSYT